MNCCRTGIEIPYLFNNSERLLTESDTDQTMVRLQVPKVQQVRQETAIGSGSNAGYTPVIPPLTEMYCPVIQRLFSDAISSTPSAMSAVVPILSSARVSATRGSVTALDSV